MYTINYLRKKLPENFSDLLWTTKWIITTTNLSIVPNINTNIYGSNFTMTLKAIKQWNELQNFVKTDFFSPEMTYILLFQTLKVKFINVGLKPSYIENQWTKTSNYFYYHNTFSVKLTSHLLLIKLLHAMFWYS